jgi:hypothetical protein
VHNLVNDRVSRERRERHEAADVRPQWPSLQQCDECYAEGFRNATEAAAHGEQWRSEQWQPAMVFIYMQVPPHPRPLPPVPPSCSPRRVAHSKGDKGEQESI